jgi:putative ABC transport system permease protein
MIVAVLEPRSEVGFRRALGATEGQIRAQFLGESILLAVITGPSFGGYILPIVLVALGLLLILRGSPGRVR